MIADRYQLRAEIGRGGLGVVHAAFDRVIGREVAVKVIPLGLPGEASREQRRQWVLREARAAGGLSHPNIVTVHDAGEQGDDAYIVMELVAGRSAAAAIEADARLAPQTVSRIALQCAAALDYAHGRGVFHRDIKPANILLLPDQSAKLVDFGLARMAEATKLTQTGVLIGTPQYMSPEQLQGLTVQGPSDQFSLAVTVFELLTGVVPFEGEGLIYQILNTPPPPVTRTIVTLPKAVDAAIARAMAKEPAKRYPSCADFAAALQAAIAGAPPSAPSRLPWAAAAVGAAALIGGFGLWLGRTPSPAPAPASEPTSNPAAPGPAAPGPAAPGPAAPGPAAPGPAAPGITAPNPSSRAPAEETTPAPALPKKNPPPAQKAALPPRAETAAPSPSLTPPAPPAPASVGSGTIIWSGALASGAEVSVDGSRCSTGIVTRPLPGTPVQLRITPASVQLLDAPSEANQWRGWRVRNTGREVDSFIVTFTAQNR